MPLLAAAPFSPFPALIAAGLPPIDANASNTVALFPGQIATGYAARDGLAAASADSRVNVPVLAAISLVGGFLGGILLLVTPQPVFSRIVPWLILFATAIFAGGNFMPRTGKKFRLNRTGIFAVQGLVAIYGGYFGGGAGILMLSAFTFFGLRDIWLMNSLKILLVTLMNAAAVDNLHRRRSRSLALDDPCRDCRDCGRLCRACIRRGGCQRIIVKGLRCGGGLGADRLFLHETGLTECVFRVQKRVSRRIMLMMRQIYFDGHGGPDVIRIGEAPVPEPGPGQVLIEVAAAGINRPDCLQRQGVYPPPPGESAIPGP